MESSNINQQTNEYVVQGVVQRVVQGVPSSSLGAPGANRRGQAKVLESPLWLGADRAAQASALPPRRRAACSELADFPMTRICSLCRKMPIVPSNPRSPL